MEAKELVSKEVLANASLMIGETARAIDDSNAWYGELMALCSSSDYETTLSDIGWEVKEGCLVNEGDREYWDPDDEEVYDIEEGETVADIVDIAVMAECDRHESMEGLCRYLDLEPYTQDVYEHWIVSDRLAEKLKARGEVVKDFMNLTIWGRTTTGQAIAMDGVIEAIAQETA